MNTLVDKRMSEAAQRIKTRNNTKLGGGGVSVNAESVKWGTCGMSYVRLSRSGAQTQGQAYVESGFELEGVQSASSFWTTTSVFKSGWSKILNASGNLNGDLWWDKGTRVTVPNTADYSARFTAKVTVVKSNGEGGSCSSLEPLVSNVSIYVSK